MAFGKLYTREGNVRSIAIKAVAKANNIELEEVDTDARKGPLPTDYYKINKLGKVPAFVGADGYTLNECIAIAVYITSQNAQTPLLGKTKQDYASILQWMSFSNSELLPPTIEAFEPLLGRVPYNKKVVDDALKATMAATKVLEQHLLVNTFLVGERLTLADLFVAGEMTRGFDFFYDKSWREQHPSTTRWYETINNQAIHAAVAPKLNFIDSALKNQAPKKEEKPKAAKPAAAAKPKAAAKDDDEEEEDAPAPKPKHPLESLPRASIPLDELKRKYSNEDTPVALKWFWENYNPAEYSLWKVDYKYNDELTQTFMSSNLIGGFFARLEASRKYIFGSASVFGTSGDSVIQGAFVIRGQEALPAFDVAPDYESYEFSKLDAAKPADKEFIESMWSWDRPTEVGGKSYPHADGKVFK